MTYKEVIANAATNMGRREATMSACVSAVNIARKRKLINRKNGAGPECRP